MTVQLTACLVAALAIVCVSLLGARGRRTVAVVGIAAVAVLVACD